MATRIKEQDPQVNELQWTPMSDQELVLRARIDRGAFTDIYRRYVQRVYKYCLSRSGNTQDAEEICSQTFLAALEDLQNFRGEGDFSAWLFGIARRKAARHYRRQPSLSLDLVVEIADQTPLPEELAVYRISLTQVLSALRALSSDRAEAIRLYFFAGLTVSEMSGVMHKNEAAVRMLLHRGIKDLRERLVVENRRGNV